MNKELYQKIINVIAADPGNRQIPRLAKADELMSALQVLIKARRVLLISGFYIGRAKAWETDGPLGTLVLADALLQSGTEVAVLTDTGAMPIFDSGLRLLSLDLPVVGFEPNQAVPAEALLSEYEPDVIIAIERVGQAKCGRYYNSSGYDVTEQVAHFDPLFSLAAIRKIPTIAVGDGGNELGFGALAEVTEQLLGQKSYACVTPSDYLLPCGVSNWGGYALAALLAMARGTDCLNDEELLRKLLIAIVEAGAVDGIKGEAVATVDGLPLELEVNAFCSVMELANKGILKAKAR